MEEGWFELGLGGPEIGKEELANLVKARLYNSAKFIKLQILSLFENEIKFEVPKF